MLGILFDDLVNFGSQWILCMRLPWVFVTCWSHWRNWFNFVEHLFCEIDTTILNVLNNTHLKLDLQLIIVTQPIESFLCAIFYLLKCDIREFYNFHQGLSGMFSNYCLVAIIGITSSFFSLKSEPNSFFSETGIKYFYNSRTLNHSDLIKHVKIISIRSAPNTKFWTEKKLIQRIMCVNRKATEKLQNQGRNHENEIDGNWGRTFIDKERKK